MTCKEKGSEGERRGEEIFANLVALTDGCEDFAEK
jgi:hypothetical protein